MKLVTFAANEPFVLAVTGVEVSIVCAILTLPQGDALDGRCTSLRTGLALTPSAGEIMACAETCAESTRANTEAGSALKNMTRREMGEIDQLGLQNTPGKKR